MRTFPSEFEDLLTATGRRVLTGHALQGVLTPERPFALLRGLVDARKAAACAALLDEALLGTLSEMSDPIPPETITHMQHNYDEWLPKTVRVRTAYLDRRTSRSWIAADRVGLIRLMRSESFAAFAAALAGKPLRPKWGMQVLCYTPGDYAGPHNDHHPEEPEARDGYLDVHLSLANSAVAHQWLVYADRGHFSQMENVATAGGVTAYRLPFWHYTTPLVAKARRETKARRWVLLGTFLFASPKARTMVRPPHSSSSSKRASGSR